jgi:beta-phosphoglucomutase
MPMKGIFSSARIRAVLFDMDGVITDTMPYHMRAWRRVFKKAGVAVTRLEVYRREGQPGRLTIREIFKERGIAFSDDGADRMLEDKERIFKRIVRRRFVRGARSILKDLRRRGLRMALVTGTSRPETMRILPGPIVAMFDAIVTGSEVKHGKPHPEPYLLALKGLGIPASAAFVVENAPFGITSAKRAGLMCAALRTSLPQRYLKEADVVAASFKDLRGRRPFCDLLRGICHEAF